MTMIFLPGTFLCVSPFHKRPLNITNTGHGVFLQFDDVQLQPRSEWSNRFRVLVDLSYLYDTIDCNCGLDLVVEHTRAKAERKEGACEDVLKPSVIHPG